MRLYLLKYNSYHDSFEHLMNTVNKNGMMVHYSVFSGSLESVWSEAVKTVALWLGERGNNSDNLQPVVEAWP